MKHQKNEDKISRIMSDPEKVRDIIQSGINEALLRHKQAGNPVCGLKNGKIFWLAPKDLMIQK